MKRLQLGIAFALLVGMVFLITFAMNYLGSSLPTPVESVPAQPVRALVFLQKNFPPEAVPGLEAETHVRGSVDYPFYNPNEEEVSIGLNRKSCRCAGVEVLVMPEANRKLVQPWALTLCGSTTPLLAIPIAAQGRAVVEKGATGTELLEKDESAVVPGKAMGWVRLHYKGERSGPQTLDATLWMDDRSGSQATLQLRMIYYPPFTVEPILDIGTLRDDDLQKSVTRHIVLWSATRAALRVEAKSAFVRGSPAQDPFVVGKPEPLSAVELANLARSAKCGYRIPITLLPRSPDGEVPFDLGPFRRWVNLSSPDVDEDAKPIAVTGRIRGLVEIGSDDEISEINFATFPQARGRRETIQLYSDFADVKLSFDRQRTPDYLQATITEVKSPDARRTWELRAEVLPNKVSGPFPRRTDPALRDSAFYLNAQLPGKPPRSIRIAAVGNATLR